MNASILTARSFSLPLKLFVAAMFCMFALVLMPAPAHAAGLTTPQIEAVLGLLEAFNIPQATLDNVGAILRGSSAGIPMSSSESATFLASPSSGGTPLSVYFQGSGSILDAGAYISFGDGESSGYGEVVIGHTYSNPGTYTALLHKNGAKGEVVATKTISVSSSVSSEKGYALVATPTSGQAPLTVTFSISLSGTGHSVNFGDDSVAGFSGSSVTHTYTEPGTYTATLYKCTLHVSEKDCDRTEIVAHQAVTVTSPTVSMSSSYQPRGSSLVASVAMVPLSATTDSLNLIADQIVEVNYALASVLSAYVELFSMDTVAQAAAATVAPPVASAQQVPAGESLGMTLAYLPQSLYETAGNTTDFLAAVEMAPVYVIVDGLSDALFKAGIY
jgi:hypothetical protein